MFSSIKHILDIHNFIIAIHIENFYGCQCIWDLYLSILQCGLFLLYQDVLEMIGKLHTSNIDINIKHNLVLLNVKSKSCIN